MINENKENIQAEIKSLRPFGVWILTVINVVLGIHWLLPVYYVLISPPNEEDLMSPGAVPSSYFFIVLFVILFFSSCGTWAGNKIARAFLLCTLSFIAALEIQEIVLMSNLIIERAQSDSKFLRPIGTWWSLSALLRWLLWLGFNYWYLLGSRTQEFFSKSDS